MTDKETMKLALDALAKIACTTAMDYEYQRWAREAIAAIKERLAQPEQEPSEKFCDSNCVWTDHHSDCELAQPAPVLVNWNKPELNTLRHSDHCRYWNDGEFCTCGALEYEELKFWKNKALAQPSDHFANTGKPIPAAQRTWVGLTDEEIQTTWDSVMDGSVFTRREVYKAIEAKLKEKNND